MMRITQSRDAGDLPPDMMRITSEPGVPVARLVMREICLPLNPSACTLNAGDAADEPPF